MLPLTNNSSTETAQYHHKQTSVCRPQKKVDLLWQESITDILFHSFIFHILASYSHRHAFWFCQHTYIYFFYMNNNAGHYDDKLLQGWAWTFLRTQESSYKALSLWRQLPTWLFICCSMNLLTQLWIISTTIERCCWFVQSTELSKVINKYSIWEASCSLEYV